MGLCHFFERARFFFLILSFFIAWGFEGRIAAADQYRFDVDRLNQLGQQAVSEVNTRFAELQKGTNSSVIEEMAKNYFYSDSYTEKNRNRDDASLEIAESTRTELVEGFKTETILSHTLELFREAYPGLLLEKPKWIWNNVGGIYARLLILYCSGTEYIALFGSPLPQQGFSGKYTWMDVYDIMIQGKMKSHQTASERSFPDTYLAGDISLLKKNESRVYSMEKNTYMIDYGRGFIPAAFWQGTIAPYFFINHDFDSFTNTVTQCGRSFLQGFSASPKQSQAGLN